MNRDASAIVVSRMDRPLGPVLDAIIPHVGELLVVRGRDGVLDRWRQTLLARFPICYTQDDDCVVDVAAVLAQYEPGKIVCNMPQDHRRDYRDNIALVGWGCVFETRLPALAITRYDEATYAADEIFQRECDRVVTGLSPLKLIDVPFHHLPYAHGIDRMGREARHGADLKEIRRRIYAIRNGK